MPRVLGPVFLIVKGINTNQDGKSSVMEPRTMGRATVSWAQYSGGRDSGSVTTLVHNGLNAFTTLTQSRSYPATVELFGQGSSAQEVLLIEHGIVKLIRVEEQGRELITGLRFPGCILGAAAVVIQQPHHVTAVALTKCSLRSMSATAFCELLMTDRLLSWVVHQMHGHEISDQMIRATQFGCLSACQRLQEILSSLASTVEVRPSQSELRLKIPLKQWELAELVAITPEHLSRLLRKLEMQGILRRDRGWLILSRTWLTSLIDHF